MQPATGRTHAAPACSLLKLNGNAAPLPPQNTRTHTHTPSTLSHTQPATGGRRRFPTAWKVPAARRAAAPRG
eukprot:353484-Chlamydomonas_euryale.AAC.1